MTSISLKEKSRAYILDLIRRENLHPGDRLPSQRELSRAVHVSPKISEVVLNELEAEKLVIRQRGRGTYLADLADRASLEVHISPNVYLLLPSLRNPHFAEDAANAEIALVRANRSLRIITGEAMPRAAEIIAKMIREGIGGIIALNRPEGLRDFALRNHVPLVEIRYQSPSVRCPSKGRYVVADMRASAMQLADHLLSLGHTRIYLAGALPAGSQKRPDYRFHFLEEYLSRHGAEVIHLPQELPVSSYPSYETIGVELARKMLKQGLPATAAIFYNSPRAVGAMRFFQKEGIRIPDDFSIAGFGPSLQRGLPEPMITSSVHRNVIEEAVSLLLSESDEAFQSRLISPVLVIGTSTAEKSGKSL